MIDRENRINYKAIDRNSISKQLVSYTKDITEDNILSYDGEEFLKACYRFFFDREADERGLSSYLALLNDGMSKEGMLYIFAKSEEFDNRFLIKYFKNYKRYYLRYQWDIRNLLQYEGWDFIEHCYLDILDRHPDKTGIYEHIKHMVEGMPREAMVYLFANSEEAKSVKGIKDVQMYKQAYEDYEKYRLRRDFKGRIKRKLKSWAERVTNKQEIKYMLLLNQAQAAFRTYEIEKMYNDIKKTSSIQTDKVNELINVVDVLKNKIEKTDISHG